MKLKTDVIFEEFKPNTLFFDDINEIFNIFKENNSQVTISTDKYEDIKEIEKLRDITIKELEFISHNNSEYMSLKFGKETTQFISTLNSINAYGTLSKIKEKLNETKKSNLYKFANFFKFMAMILIWFFINKIILAIFQSNFVIYISAIMVIIMFSINMKFFEYKNDFILSKNRIDYSFYREYKEWITTITGTILGYLLGKFL